MAAQNDSSMVDSHWLNWCRLCAKDDARGNVNIYTRPNETTWNSVLIMAIRKYFDVHMQLENELGGVLCKECYTLISELIDFAEHVTKVQAIFEVLRRSDPNSQLDMEALRQQYGLRESDWTHIIKPELENGTTKQMTTVDKPIPSDLPKQESKDIDEATKPLQANEENISNFLPIEEVLVAEWTDAEKGGSNPIRPRARRKSAKHSGFNDSSRTAKVRRVRCKKEPEAEAMPHNTDEKEVLELPTSTSEEVIDENFPDIPSKRQNMTCGWCGKIYHNPASYQKHLRVACRKIEQRTKVDKNTYCDLCDKTLSSAAALKLHKEGMHDNAKPFVCDHCGKQLKTITALNEHKLVHTDERPFSCTICKAGFKNRARLKIHKQTHDAPSYVCNICGKKLQTRRTWNMHKLVHSEERKFKCDVCGALFKRSKTLKTHLLSHTGLRPYVCNFCGQTFACNANCRAHKMKKHSHQLKAEESEGTSSRLNVPTLEELRVMSQKIPKVEVETAN